MRRALMCSPDFFEVSYVINPWMSIGGVDTARAKRQWQELFKTLGGLGVQVEGIAQHKGLPDMVFATDQGIVVGSTMYLSSFFYPQRQGETAHYKQWFEEHGFIVFEQDEVQFEGGEVVGWCEKYFLGTGFRSQKESVPTLKRFLQKEVIALELVDPRFYHLDMCLFPLTQDTVFYYPDAFSKNSQHLLHRMIPNLCALSQHEALGFCANSVVVGSTVLVAAENPSFTKKLERLGYTAIELDISEFIKAGGGIHCLVLPLA